MLPDQVYAITIELFLVANLLCRRRLPFENIEQQFPHLRSTGILASRKAVTAASYYAQPPLRRGSPPTHVLLPGDGTFSAGMHVCSTERIAPLKMTIYAYSEAVPVISPTDSFAAIRGVPDDLAAEVRSLDRRRNAESARFCLAGHSGW